MKYKIYVDMKRKNLNQNRKNRLFKEVLAKTKATEQDLEYKLLCKDLIHFKTNLKHAKRTADQILTAGQLRRYKYKKAKMLRGCRLWQI